MSEHGKYIAIRVSQADCDAQHLAKNGLPCLCERKPVWELVHSDGQSFHTCEFHIEILWDVWVEFREAVRDVWPIAKK